MFKTTCLNMFDTEVSCKLYTLCRNVLKSGRSQEHLERLMGKVSCTVRRIFPPKGWPLLSLYKKLEIGGKFAFLTPKNFFRKC